MRDALSREDWVRVVPHENKIISSGSPGFRGSERFRERPGERARGGVGVVSARRGHNASDLAAVGHAGGSVGREEREHGRARAGDRADARERRAERRAPQSLTAVEGDDDEDDDKSKK